MIVFNQMNKKGKCPICNTSRNSKAVLIGILGTEDGGNIQAEQFHLDCIDLSYQKEDGILFQRITKEK